MNPHPLWLVCATVATSGLLLLDIHISKERRLSAERQKKRRENEDRIIRQIKANLVRDMQAIRAFAQYGQELLSKHTRK